MSSPDNQALREHLVRLIHQSGIFGLREADLEEPFIRGEVNPELAEIGMDSLSEMELCIAIENELGVSIVPVELERMKRLDDLFDRIRFLRGD